MCMCVCEREREIRVARYIEKHALALPRFNTGTTIREREGEKEQLGTLKSLRLVLPVSILHIYREKETNRPAGLPWLASDYKF